MSKCSECGEECAYCKAIEAADRRLPWRNPQRVAERHAMIVDLRSKGLYLTEIGSVVRAKFGGKYMHHSSILHHLRERCRCLDTERTPAG